MDVRNDESEFIPSIDFSLLSLDIEDSDLNLELLELIAEHVMFALRNTGFLYLKNCGLQEELIRRVNSTCEEFFTLAAEEKSKFSRSKEEGRNHGWVAFGVESLDPDKPADLKEAFNVNPAEVEQYSMQWPNDPFQQTIEELYAQLKRLSLRFLRVLAVGLGQEDSFFLDNHSSIGEKDNATALRCLFYPPVKKSELGSVEEGQLRCGEHSDYGSITLLVTDDVAGLQVKNRDGNFVDISRPDSCAWVLVNLGDLIQRWTDDSLVAAKHRVVFRTPPDIADEDSNVDSILCPKRQSIAFFVHPDDATIVKSFAESSKYPPISAAQYLKERFEKTYK